MFINIYDIWDAVMLIICDFYLNFFELLEINIQYKVQ